MKSAFWGALLYFFFPHDYWAICYLLVDYNDAYARVGYNAREKGTVKNTGFSKV